MVYPVVLLLVGLAAVALFALHVVAQVEGEMWVIFTVVWNAIYSVVSMAMTVLVTWAAPSTSDFCPHGGADVSAEVLGGRTQVAQH